MQVSGVPEDETRNEAHKNPAAADGEAEGDPMSLQKVSGRKIYGHDHKLIIEMKGSE